MAFSPQALAQAITGGQAPAAMPAPNPSSGGGLGALAAMAGQQPSMQMGQRPMMPPPMGQQSSMPPSGFTPPQGAPFGQGGGMPGGTPMQHPMAPMGQPMGGAPIGMGQPGMGAPPMGMPQQAHTQQPPFAGMQRPLGSGQ